MAKEKMLRFKTSRGWVVFPASTKKRKKEEVKKTGKFSCYVVIPGTAIEIPYEIRTRLEFGRVYPYLADARFKAKRINGKIIKIGEMK